MCTVTFIPQPKGDFILTSNRDENAVRSPQNISQVEQAGATLIFPRDTLAGGTWIAASDDGRVVCLLNGAFEKHKHQPPYKHSRGTMVLDFFIFPSVQDFFKKYDFEGLEPFTFIMVNQEGGLFELRWDGKDTYKKELDSKGFYMWSSASLYTAQVREQRRKWFREWCENRLDFSLEAIQQFHQYGGDGDPWNGFIMNRFGLVQTVSITNIVKQKDETGLIYNDLLRNRITQNHLNLKNFSKN